MLPAYYDKKTRFHLYMKRKKSGERERRTKIFLQCWCCFQGYFNIVYFYSLIHTIYIWWMVVLTRAPIKCGKNWVSKRAFITVILFGMEIISFSPSSCCCCYCRDKCQLFPPKHLFFLRRLPFLWKTFPNE